MTRKTHHSLFLLAILLALPALAVAQDDKPARGVVADSSAKSVPDTQTDSVRTWYYSYNDAVMFAQKDKRQILLVFETEWCKWCKAMNDTTWIDPAVLNFSKSVVFTKIDGELDTIMVDRYHVRRFPTAILASDQGIEVDRFVGYFSPKDFREELTRAMEGTGTIWEFDRILKERNDADIMMREAREYLDRGEPNRALEFLTRAKSTDIDGNLGVADDAMFVEAMVERDARHWYKALEVLKKLVRNYPESEWREDAELYIAWLLAKAGDEKESLKKYNDFLKNYSGSTETQWVQRQIAKLESEQGTVPTSAPSQPEGQ